MLRADLLLYRAQFRMQAADRAECQTSLHAEVPISNGGVSGHLTQQMSEFNGALHAQPKDPLNNL